MSDDYKSICDICGRRTWYDGNIQCHCTYHKTKTCKTCGHSEQIGYKRIRCAGTLRPIDNSDLNSDFTPYYVSKQRIKVDFGYEIKSGTVGKTTGWKPSYILMLKCNSIGSSYVIDKNCKILGIVK